MTSSKDITRYSAFVTQCKQPSKLKKCIDVESFNIVMPDTCETFDLTWFTPEEYVANKEKNTESMTLYNNLFSCEIGNFFSLLRTAEKLTEYDVTETELTAFCTEFVTKTTGMFSSIPTSKKIVSDKLSHETLLKWLVVYYSCFFESKIFAMIFKESEISTPQNVHLLFRPMVCEDNNKISVFNKICSTGYINNVVDLIGLEETWKLMSNTNANNFGVDIIVTKIFQYETYNSKLFNSNDEKIIEMITNYRGYDQRNIMYHVVENFYYNVSNNMPIADGVIEQFTKFKHLLRVPDASNSTPLMILDEDTVCIQRMYQAKLIDINDLLSCHTTKNENSEDTHESILMNSYNLNCLTFDMRNTLISEHFPDLLNILIHNHSMIGKYYFDNSNEFPNVRELINEMFEYINNITDKNAFFNSEIELKESKTSFPTYYYFGIINFLNIMIQKYPTMTESIKQIVLSEPYILPELDMLYNQDQNNAASNMMHIAKILIENNKIEHLVGRLFDLSLSSGSMTSCLEIVDGIVNTDINIEHLKQDNYTIPTLICLSYGNQTNEEMLAKYTSMLTNVITECDDAFDNIMKNLVSRIIGNIDVMTLTVSDDDTGNNTNGAWQCMYDFDPTKFVDFINSQKLIFTKCLNNENMLTTMGTIVEKARNISHEINDSVLFGDTNDEFNKVFDLLTKSTNLSNLYTTMISNGYLQSFYTNHKEYIINKLKQKNKPVSIVIMKLPKITNDVLYENDGYESFTLDNADSRAYIKWCFENYPPTIEFKKKFSDYLIKSEMLNMLTSELIELFLKMDIISPESLQEKYLDIYTKLMEDKKDIMKQLIETTFVTDDFIKFFDLNNDNNYKILTVLFTNYRPNVYIHRLTGIKRTSAGQEQYNPQYECKEFKTSIMKNSDKIVASLLDYHKSKPNGDPGLFVFFVSNKLFSDTDVIKIADIISNEAIALTIFENYDLNKIVPYVNNVDTFIKMMSVKETKKYKKHLTIVSTMCKDDPENFTKFIEFMHKNNFNVVKTLYENLPENKDGVVDKALIITPDDYASITRLLIETSEINSLSDAVVCDLIVKIMSHTNLIDIKPVIEQYIRYCITSKRNVMNGNEIYKVYPDLILLHEKFYEICNDISVDTYCKILGSKLMTSEYQDMLLNHIGEKYDLSTTLKNIQFESKYIKDNFNKISSLISRDIQIFENFMKNQICVEQCMFMMDTNNDYMLFYILNSIDENLFHRFIDNIPVNELLSLNKKGHHKILQLCNASLSNLIESTNKFMTIFNYVFDKLLKIDDHKIRRKVLTNLVPMIKKIDSKIIISKLDEHYEVLRDDLNRNIYMMKALNIHEQTELLEIILKYDVEKQKKILQHIDDDGNILLHYFAKNSEIISQVIDVYVSLFGKDILEKSNNNNQTLLMYCIQKCPNSIDHILENKNIGSEQNYVYLTTGSAFTYSMLYCTTDEISHKLLQWDHFDKKFMSCSQDIKICDWESCTNPIYDKHVINMKTMGIMCLKKPTLFEKFLRCDMTYSKLYYENLGITFEELTHLFNTCDVAVNGKKYSFIQMIYLYSPLSFQILVTSDFISKVKYDKQFFCQNYNVQPASWYYYVKSSEFTKNAHPQTDFYHMSSHMRPSDISNSGNYIQAVNEPAENENEQCSLCTIAKKSVLYGCHQHFSCTSCAVKSYKCPFCNNNNAKIKIG